MSEAKGKLKIGVIGLGYVGLPLAFLFLNKGFEIIGIDNDKNKIKKIKNLENYLPEISNNELKRVFENKTFTVSSDYELMKDVNVIIICLPTPLTNLDKPDLTYLTNAAECLIPILKKGHLIILESSSYPGTTREVLQSIIEKSELEVGKDIYLAYSPERLDPGNRQYVIQEIPKVVSGITDKCLDKVVDVYSKVFNKVVKVSNPEVAEMSKLLENSYRFINISFINEFSMICDLLKIDVEEVIRTAGTKPFGFVPFYPGPGIGGHCIPVDPIYLQWIASQVGGKSEFIDVANRINKQMPEYIVYKILQLLSVNQEQLINKKILLCGVTYKRDINDLRNSPAISIMKSLLNKGAEISYHDPFVKKIYIYDKEFESIELQKDNLKEFDCVVILTDHSSLPFDEILKFSKIVYNTRHYKSSINEKFK